MEFSRKRSRCWLDSADSCLRAHESPERLQLHRRVLLTSLKMLSQGQPDPRAGRSLLLAGVSDSRTPSCAGDRVQVALRRSGCPRTESAGPPGHALRSPAPSLSTLRRPCCVRPWRVQNVVDQLGGRSSAAGARGGRLPEPRGRAEMQLSLSQAPGSIPGFRLEPQQPVHTSADARLLSVTPYPDLHSDRRL